VVRGWTHTFNKVDKISIVASDLVLQQHSMERKMPETHEKINLPSDANLSLRVVPMPKDTNFIGDIFGGWIMAHVDLAGAAAASRITRGRIVTVVVNQFIFKQPISLGDLVSFYTYLERIGTTSITIRVEVYAERNPADLQVVKVTQASLTYVAVDDKGVPRKIEKPQ
jgi:acyl-CoA thioesterase YciA